MREAARSSLSQRRRPRPRSACRRWAVTLALLALPSCVARAGYVRYAPSPDRWGVVALDDAGFGCRMPGEPILARSTERDFDGTPLEAAEGQLVVGDSAVLGFVVVEAEGGFIEDPYEKAQEAASAGDGQEIVREERRFRHDGFWVTERVLDRPQDEVTIHLRVFLGESRLYGMYVGYATQDEERVGGLVDAYFASAQLDPDQRVTPVGDGSLALDSWRYIYPPEAEFAIAMPGAARGSEAKESHDDLEATVYSYSVGDEDAPGSFEVIVHTFDDTPSGEVTDKVKAALVPAGLERASERFVHQRGFGGDEALYRAGDRELLVRTYRTASRLYTLRVWTRAGPPDEIANARARFLRSFRIL